MRVFDNVELRNMKDTVMGGAVKMVSPKRWTMALQCLDIGFSV